MKKIKKIKIKLNGKVKIIPDKCKVLNLIKELKVPINKVAIELNQEILNKKKLNKINLQNNDKIEKRKANYSKQKISF